MTQNHEQRSARYREAVERRLARLARAQGPADLAAGCQYILTSGGKRVRSTIVMLACEAVGGRWQSAIDAGTAVEILHNFTLVHDDIMDNAESRRGRPTVHKQWNVNNALLVGDVLVAIAYECLLATKTRDHGALTRVFTAGLHDVCDGQAYDLELGSRNDATVRDYFAMIELKTGRLIRMSAILGGMIGGGTRKQVAALATYGHCLGRAFQLRDDLLDVIADEETFGKKIGGDILEGKKTFLLLRAAEAAEGEDRVLLDEVKRRKPDLSSIDAREFVAAVTAAYRRTGVIEEAEKLIRDNTRRGIAALRALPAGHAREGLTWLATSLVARHS